MLSFVNTLFNVMRLTLVIFSVFAWPPNLLASEQEVAVVIYPEGLNVREGPGQQYTRLRRVAPGEEYNVLEHDESKMWVRVQFPDGGTGWISAVPDHVRIEQRQSEGSISNTTIVIGVVVVMCLFFFLRSGGKRSDEAGTEHGDELKRSRTTSFSTSDHWFCPHCGTQYDNPPVPQEVTSFPEAMKLFFERTVRCPACSRPINCGEIITGKHNNPPDLKPSPVSKPTSARAVSQLESQLKNVSDSVAGQDVTILTASPAEIPIGYFQHPAILKKGVCSYRECPCDDVEIPNGQGYLYVSETCVRFRQDARSFYALNKKIENMEKQTNHMIMLDQGIDGPILMCEQGANLLQLDLKTAAADARHWWETGHVPLRPTPKAKLGGG